MMIEPGPIGSRTDWTADYRRLAMTLDPDTPFCAAGALFDANNLHCEHSSGLVVSLYVTSSISGRC
eukprot:1187877-Prorocentrum_minimum.AAC.1